MNNRRDRTGLTVEFAVVPQSSVIGIQYSTLIRQPHRGFSLYSRMIRLIVSRSWLSDRSTVSPRASLGA